MCAIVEEYTAKRSAVEKKEAVQRANRKAIINGFRTRIFTKENVINLYPHIKQPEIEALYLESQRPVRARKGQ